MNLYAIPWLELSILVPLVGAAASWWYRGNDASSRCGLGSTAATLVCTLLAWAGFEASANPGGAAVWEVLPRLLGKRFLEIDQLSAPLLPLVALLHFLIVLATSGTKLAQISYPMLLFTEAVRLAVFATVDPWPLIALFAVSAILPYLELRWEGKGTRVYALHMFVVVVLFAVGWAFVENDLAAHLQPSIACIPLLLGVLIRSGTVPAHLWVADLFENALFSTAVLNATPIVGMYAAVRLVLPVCPDWVLHSIGLFSLITAAYAAGMGLVQHTPRRFFAYLFLSHASMILVGLELHTAISLTGALALWYSVALSLAGLGLTLRAVEARFGRLDLTEFHGLYEHSPALAVCFLITGLASVGFPGTLGFVATEMLVDGAIGVNLGIGLVIVVTTALNGIAVLRIYFLIFTGGRHLSAVSLGITLRERIAVLTLAALILGGGLIPQTWLESRHRAAEVLLKNRNRHMENPTSSTTVLGP
ncbi:MAG TPA: proton-conducting transporter membrane subunit [Gemmata sp.]|jgi:NADH-quinone oxidoreductase subunit M|nr:proton-conducting transporter membrane subunit [Gemmata sp.]